MQAHLLKVEGEHNVDEHLEREPVDHLLQRENDVRVEALALARILALAPRQDVGADRGAFEAVVDHVVPRKAVGRPVGD